MDDLEQFFVEQESRTNLPDEDIHNYLNRISKIARCVVVHGSMTNMASDFRHLQCQMPGTRFPSRSHSLCEHYHRSKFTIHCFRKPARR